MRLIEIADPQEYTPTVAEAEGFLRQLLRIWSDQFQTPPPMMRRKLFDASVTKASRTGAR